jgi:TrpR-related protein YerC/YecD
MKHYEKIPEVSAMYQMQSESLDRLFDVILQLEDREDCYRFFDDLCTVKEMQDLSQRLEVAMRLHQGENYLNIAKATGASTATISRVSKCLNYGSGGYRRAIEKAGEEQP